MYSTELKSQLPLFDISLSFANLFYASIKLSVLGFVDDTHAAFAEFFQDFVMG